MKCQFCKEPAKATKDRLPNGWRRLADSVVCPKCWKERFVLRAVTFPVARPVDCDWPAFREKMAAAWAESTGLANWAVQQLAKGDIVRTPKMAKLPKWKRPYLYGLFNKEYVGRQAWAGSTSSAQSLFRAVEKKYAADRFAVVWTRENSLPSFRYPVPFPVHNQDWWASWSDDGRKVPLVSICLPGGRVTLQLRREASLGRQLAMFKQIESGEAVACEAAIYRQTKGGSHRNGLAARENGGGRTIASDVMMKLVAWFPRKAAGELVSTMVVRSDPAALWVAEVSGHGPWILNADHVRRWAAEHRCKLQRTSEDTKADKRIPARQRKRISELRNVWAQKYDDRMKTFCHTAAKQLAEYAERQKVAEMIYDTEVRTYLPDFCWARLEGCLKQKLDDRGILLTTATRKEEAT